MHPPIIARRPSITLASRARRNMAPALGPRHNRSSGRTALLTQSGFAAVALKSSQEGQKRGTPPILPLPTSNEANITTTPPTISQISQNGASSGPLLPLLQEQGKQMPRGIAARWTFPVDGNWRWKPLEETATERRRKSRDSQAVCLTAVCSAKHHVRSQDYNTSGGAKDPRISLQFSSNEGSKSRRTSQTTDC